MYLRTEALRSLHHHQSPSPSLPLQRSPAALSSAASTTDYADELGHVREEALRRIHLNVLLTTAPAGKCQTPGSDWLRTRSRDIPQFSKSVEPGSKELPKPKPRILYAVFQNPCASPRRNRKESVRDSFNLPQRVTVGRASHR